MTMTGSRNWRTAPARDRRLAPDASRAKTGLDISKTGLDINKTGPDLKQLAKSKASLDESERRLSRQMVLMAELRANGSVTTEVEKSLMRLEAAVHEQRADHEGLLSQTGASDGIAVERGSVSN